MGFASVEYLYVVVRARARILLLLHRNARHRRTCQIKMWQYQMGQLVGDPVRFVGMNFRLQNRRNVDQAPIVDHRFHVRRVEIDDDQVAPVNV